LIQKKLVTPKVEITVKQAIDLLESRGFKVEKIDADSNSKQVKIVNDFYTGIKNLLGPERAAFLSINDKDDLLAIERFNKKAERLGISKPESIDVLQEVVSIFFKEYDSLGLKSCPNSLSFLLSSKGNWIVSKLLQLIKHRQENYDESPEAEKYKDSIYEIEDDAFKKLQKERHEKILKDGQ